MKLAGAAHAKMMIGAACDGVQRGAVHVVSSLAAVQTQRIGPFVAERHTCVSQVQRSKIVVVRSVRKMPSLEVTGNPWAEGRGGVCVRA